MLDFNRKRAEVLLADHPRLHAAVARVRTEGTRDAEEQLRKRLDQAHAVFCSRSSGDDRGEYLAQPAPGGGGALVAFSCLDAVDEHFPKEWATEEEGWRANVGKLTELCKEAAARGLSGVIVQGPGQLRIGLTGDLMRELAGQGPAKSRQILSPDGSSGFRQLPIPAPQEALDALRGALQEFTTIRQAWLLEAFQSRGAWRPTLTIRLADGVAAGPLAALVAKKLGPLFAPESALTVTVLEPGTDPVAYELLAELAEDLIS